MYMGDQGVYTSTFQYERRDTCPACGTKSIKLSAPADIKLQQLLEMFAEHRTLQLKRPSVRLPLTNGSLKNIFWHSPPQLHDLTKPNLQLTLAQLFEAKAGDEISLAVTDPDLQNTSVTIDMKLT